VLFNVLTFSLKEESMISGNCGPKWMLKQGRTMLVLFLSLSLVFTNFTMAVAASEADAKTKMKHSPPKYFVPEHRIQLDVNVSDPKGVDLVRCYFKAAGETDFVFVPMSSTGKNTYSGVLPAPSLTSEQIEYLFLSVNSKNVIVKSQVFVLDQEDKDKVPAWQEIPMENEIQVGMELDQVPSELAGFSDNIAMDTVESSLRFGIVAGGLYQASAAMTASTTGSAASATTAGTVSAGAAGMSTAGIVGLSALGAVAIGGAAASGGSGGGSGGTSNPGTPVSEITESSLVGDWYIIEQSTSTSRWHMYCNLSSNGKAECTEYINGDPSGGIGTWSYNPDIKYFSARAGNGDAGGMEGTISGSKDNFTIVGWWADKTAANFKAVRR
jgi:hypothetical protein